MFFFALAASRCLSLTLAVAPLVWESFLFSEAHLVVEPISQL